MLETLLSPLNKFFGTGFGFFSLESNFISFGSFCLIRARIKRGETVLIHGATGGVSGS